MLRHLYRCAVRLHPSSFRQRFGGEMLYIFDQQRGTLAAFGLVLDSFLSVWRQWTFRLHFGIGLTTTSVVQQTANGAPLFATLDNFRPRTSAIVHGMVLSILLFCTTVYAIRYSWIHVVNLTILESVFHANQQISPSTNANYFSSNSPRPIAHASDKSHLISNHLQVDVIPVERDGIVGLGAIANDETFSEEQQSTAEARDESPHTVHFVTVDRNVKLEVLDWGGSGRAIVLLAGLGNTAHVFDDFAPKLISTYHVYGITRRGFGASSVPDSGYLADRLGDDVLEVIDSLGLNRPILVGHSIAGEELSSIGSRHPERVAGLVYLEAGYFYAYYDPSRGNLTLDALDVQRKLEQLQPGMGAADQRPLMRELLSDDLPQLQKDLEETLENLEGAPPPLPQPPPSSGFDPGQAILDGAQKYTKIPVPVLAIYAFPPRLGLEMGDDPATREAVRARIFALEGAQVKAFETGVPRARVVTLPDADHFIFRLNEADVLREIKLFISTLKKHG